MKNKPSFDLYHKNLQIFPKYIKELVKKINIEDVWKKVIIENSLDNKPICSIIDESNNCIRINSDLPQEEYKIWTNQIDLKKAGSLFVYGCGFGYPLFELLKQKEPNTLVFVFENSLDIFIAMLFFFDFQPIMLTKKFIFFIGKKEDFSENLLNIINTDIFLYITAPIVIFTHPAKRNFMNDYLKIHSYIFEQLSLNVFHIGNDHYDTLLGFHNIIANLKEIISNPQLSCLKNKYSEKPAFIISNGPSLDKDIHNLKKINKMGLIICTESAILPLLKNNIKPDILCVIERIENSYLYHFKDISYSEDISLLALALINKNIFPSFSGPKIPIFRNTESINIWINKWFGEANSSIDAGANISHLAFEIAVYVGANPIVLVGQDFAFGEANSVHSKYSIYSNEIAKKDDDKTRKRPLVYTENNYGAKIKTTQLWQDFRHGLERKIAQHSEKNIINTTLKGAKIKGTSLANLEQIIQKYCITKLEQPVFEIINNSKKNINFETQHHKLVLFVNELSSYINSFRKLCQSAVMATVRSNKMLYLLDEEDYQNNLDIFEKSYEENFNDLTKFMSDNLFLVFFQQVLLIGFHQMNLLGTIDSEQAMREIFEIHKNLFNNLNTISQSIVVNFDIAIDKIESY